MVDFQLIETMRVDDKGAVLLLERHVERLRNSAHWFEFGFDGAALRRAIAESAGGMEGPAYVRLVLSKDGHIDLKSGPLPADRPRRLRISPVPVDSTNPFLYHKTTRREIYDEARRGCDHETDALLVNERGEITETTITNVAVLRGGKWITPAVTCGLLAGVARAELLENGNVVEGVIRAEEVAAGERIRCFNALRGIFDVPLILCLLCFLCSFPYTFAIDVCMPTAF